MKKYFLVLNNFVYLKIDPEKRTNSGLHAIAVYEDRLEGGADPRREGLAYGNR